MNTAIATKEAPKAIGPYSQAVRTGNFLYISGQIPVNPSTGEFAPGGIAEQAAQVLHNIEAILKASGMNFSNVVKTTVFLKNLSDFAAMNEIYAQFFKEPYPARATVEVSALPKGALIEIEAVAAGPVVSGVEP